jgi:predicted DNA-binding transcriptional regulator AlpA
VFRQGLVLNAAAFAAALGISESALHKRRRRGLIPPPIRFGIRRLWLRPDVEHLFVAQKEPSDLVSGEELAALLGCSVACMYQRLRAGDLPAPIRRDGCSLWNLRDVRQHLAALPRDEDPSHA